jgi:hypothetical protein
VQMSKIIESPQLRGELREKGLERARQFDAAKAVAGTRGTFCGTAGQLTQYAHAPDTLSHRLKAGQWHRFRPAGAAQRDSS